MNDEGCAFLVGFIIAAFLSLLSYGNIGYISDKEYEEADRACQIIGSSAYRIFNDGDVLCNNGIDIVKGSSGFIINGEKV